MSSAQAAGDVETAANLSIDTNESNKARLPYSTSAVTESTESLPQTQRGRIEKFREVVVRILHEHKCYDLIPLSGKVVVFDSHLSLKHAFRALVEHDIKCAPVWSSEASEFVGLMTVTDFANILVASVFGNPESDTSVVADWERKADDLESRTVGSWAVFRKEHGTSPTRARFISVVADNSVYEAVALLHKNFIHRMPVRCMENGKSIVCIVNYQKILRFILQKIDHERESIDMRVAELGLTFDQHVPTISKDTTLLACLKILSTNRRLTAVPIVSEDGILEDAFLRSDVRFLAVNHAYKKHDISIEEFLRTHSGSRFVCRCKLQDSVIGVVYEMLRKRNHISIILDENDGVIGMLTLRDIMSLILGPSYSTTSPQPGQKATQPVTQMTPETLASALSNNDISHEYMVIDARQNGVGSGHKIRGAVAFDGANMTQDRIASLIGNDIVSRSKNLVFCCGDSPPGDDEPNCAKMYSSIRSEQFPHLPVQNTFILVGGFTRFFELYENSDLIVAN